LLIAAESIDLDICYSLVMANKLKRRAFHRIEPQQAERIPPF